MWLAAAVLDSGVLRGDQLRLRIAGKAWAGVHDLGQPSFACGLAYTCRKPVPQPTSLCGNLPVSVQALLENHSLSTLGGPLGNAQLTPSFVRWGN